MPPGARVHQTIRYPLVLPGAIVGSHAKAAPTTGIWANHIDEGKTDRGIQKRKRSARKLKVGFNFYDFFEYLNSAPFGFALEWESALRVQQPSRGSLCFEGHKPQSPNQ